MRHKTSRSFRFWYLPVVFVAMTAMILAVSGCGGSATPPGQTTQTKAAPKPAPTQAAVPAAKAEPADKAAAVPAAPKAVAPAPAAGPAPVTLPVLKLMPQSAMIGLALPPVSGINGKAIALAKRLVPPDVNVDEQVSQQVQKWAKEVGTPDAKSVPDIIKAKGFDPDAPLGVFADLAPSAASAKKALETIKAGMEKAEKPAEKPGEAPAASAAPKPSVAPKPAAPEGTAASKAERKAKRAAEKAAAPKGPSQEQMAKAWSQMELPAMVAVAGITDPAVAEKTIKDIIAQPGTGIDAAKVEEVKVGDVAVHSYAGGKCAYAIAGKQMFASNSLTLLKEALARVAAPATLRYGTADCQASAADEAVILTRGDKIAPIMVDLAPMLLSLNPKMAPYANMQSFVEEAGAYAGEDPIVTTLTWTDKDIDLLSRIDTATHPALVKTVGEVKPVRLATLLPDNTLLLFTQRLNAETKNAIRKNWLKALPPELLKNGMDQQVGQALDMIGDEITIGVAGAEGIPQIYILIGLANPEQTKTLLQLLAPMTPAGEGEGEGEGKTAAPISLLAVPLPIPVYIAFPGDVLTLCNDQDKLKTVISMIEKKQTGGLFKSLNPPIDPATPITTLAVIETDLISKVVIPLSSLAGGGMIPQEMQAPLTRVTDTVREIRIMNSQQGTWERGSVALYLK